MDERQKTELLRIAAGRVEFDSPMARRTTFRVGGNAEAVCEAGELEVLRRILPYLLKEQIPYLVMGRGSNLLVRDGGIRGVVIVLSENLGRIEWGKPDGSGILAGAGLSIADLLIGCRKRGLSGLEFLAGIPGTVGGAVAMNAGAFGSEIGAWVREITLVHPNGDCEVMERSRLRFSYRTLDMQQRAIIAQVGLRLKPETKKMVSEKISRYLTRRRASQPLEMASAGSVFRNPASDYAGRLIERAGLKGKIIGGAMISDRHANFIVNKGGATAADILSLIDLAREAVMRTADIHLELEIHVVGDPIRAHR